MPVTPREDSTGEGVKTRAQRSAEATTTVEQAGPMEATATGPTQSPTTMQTMATTAVKAESAVDLTGLMLMLQSMQTDQQRRYEEQKEDQRRLREEQKEDQRRLHEEQKVQQRLLEEQKEDQLKVLEAIGKVSNVVDQLRKDMDVVEDRVTGLETGLTTLEKKMLQLETKGIIVAPSGTISASVQGPRVKVPSYDGTTSWAAYRQQFQTVAAANGWTEEQSLTALTVALRGSALTVLEALPSSGSGFKDLMDALEARYGERHLEHVFRAQLRDRVQRSGEGLQQWALEIEKLVRKAYPSADSKTVDSNILQAFVDGIRDMEIRAAVRLRHHASLKEALAHALEVEAVRHDTRGAPKVREIVDVAEDVRAVKIPPKKTSGPGPMCYRCGERGHLQLTCPQKNDFHKMRTEMNKFLERMEELNKRQDASSSTKCQGNE